MRRWLLALALAGACSGGDPTDDDAKPSDGPTGDTDTDADTAGLSDDTAPTLPVQPPLNVLILLTDDQGTDMVAAYGEHPTPPPTPHIDALAAEGLLFRNAWAAPICSPARAALLTGRTGRRTGLGGVTQYKSGLELPTDEVIVPEVLRHADPPYSNAALGKWHIGAYNSVNSTDHALALGFDSWAGSVGNLYDRVYQDGFIHNYSHWEKVVDGQITKTDRYATTDTVDDALDKMGTLPEPWFLYVAFNAPHKPLSPPPEDLVTEPVVFGESDRSRYPKVVEALDNELGRLLDTMDPEVRERTMIFFLSDNGTPDHAVLPPRSPGQAKDTPFEGGINVPLIVAGPLVQPGTETQALVHIVDLMPTIADIAGVPLTGPDAPPELDGVALDGVSFYDVLVDPALAPRDFVHAEKFLPNGLPPYNKTDWKITRGSRFKVIETPLPFTPTYFDLQGRDDDGWPVDPDTLPAAEQAEIDALQAAHDAYWGSIPPLGPP